VAAVTAALLFLVGLALGAVSRELFWFGCELLGIQEEEPHESD
jgi:hypothetical protein